MGLRLLEEFFESKWTLDRKLKLYWLYFQPVKGSVPIREGPDWSLREEPETGLWRKKDFLTRISDKMTRTRG